MTDSRSFHGMRKPTYTIIPFVLHYTSRVTVSGTVVVLGPGRP